MASTSREKVTIEKRAKACKERIATFAVKNHEHEDLGEFLEDSNACFGEIIRGILRKQPTIKVNSTFRATFIKPSEEERRNEIASPPPPPSPSSSPPSPSPSLASASDTAVSDNEDLWELMSIDYGDEEEQRHADDESADVSDPPIEQEPENVACQERLTDGSSDDIEEEDHGMAKYTMFIASKSAAISRQTDLTHFFETKIKSFILERFEVMLLNGSGSALHSIDEIEFQVYHYNPLAGHSYIIVPTFLRMKRAIVNVENYDNECFKWAILSALNPDVKNCGRVNEYRRRLEQTPVTFTGLKFPVTLKQISKFEDNNPTYSIHVYGFNDEKKLVYPLRLSQNVKANHIHLLYLTQDNAINEQLGEFARGGGGGGGGENAANIVQAIADLNVNDHYCWISHMSRLVRSQISKHGNKVFFCDRCMCKFWSEYKLNAHRVYCERSNECIIDMPDKGDNDTIQFENHRFQLKCPFIIYADTEAILETPSKPFSKRATTTAIQEHKVYSIGFYFKSTYDDSISHYASERGKKCIEWFRERLMHIADEVQAIFDDIKPMALTQEEEHEFERATCCHICKKCFGYISWICTQ